MSKDPHFLGQSILSQVLNYLHSRDIFSELAQKEGADRYVKKFIAVEHLYTLLFAVASRVCTIREINTALAAHEIKLKHLGIE